MGARLSAEREVIMLAAKRLLYTLALMCGCAEVEATRLPTEVADTVQLSAHEPGPACGALEQVEVRSRRHDAPSADALRLYAWQRDANYVVLDSFSILDDDNEDVVLVRARLYRCPPLVRIQ
jgi:hypothetical protein